MSVSAGKQQYLAWLRTNFPDLYAKTVTAVVSAHLAQASGLSGLGDSSDFSMPDFSSGWSPDTSAPTLTVDGGSSIWDSISSSASSLFSTIANGVQQLAPTYVQTKAQLSLLDINTARAQQGLPPLTYYNGQQVTASGLAPANSSVRGVETALSTVTSPTFLLIGALGIGALVLLSSKRK
jgi:hypothetical protein